MPGVWTEDNSIGAALAPLAQGFGGGYMRAQIAGAEARESILKSRMERQQLSDQMDAIAGATAARTNYYAVMRDPNATDADRATVTHNLVNAYGRLQDVGKGTTQGGVGGAQFGVQFEKGAPPTTPSDIYRTQLTNTAIPDQQQDDNTLREGANAVANNGSMTPDQAKQFYSVFDRRWPMKLQTDGTYSRNHPVSDAVTSAMQAQIPFTIPGLAGAQQQQITTPQRTPPSQAPSPVTPPTPTKAAPTTPEQAAQPKAAQPTTAPQPVPGQTNLPPGSTLLPTGAVRLVTQDAKDALLAKTGADANFTTWHDIDTNAQNAEQLLQSKDTAQQLTALNAIDAAIKAGKGRPAGFGDVDPMGKIEGMITTQINRLKASGTAGPTLTDDARNQLAGLAHQLRLNARSNFYSSPAGLMIGRYLNQGYGREDIAQPPEQEPGLVRFGKQPSAGTPQKTSAVEIGPPTLGAPTSAAQVADILRGAPQARPTQTAQVPKTPQAAKAPSVFDAINRELTKRDVPNATAVGSR